GFPGESLSVVAGLAEVSAGRGDVKARAKPLAAARTAAEQAARLNPALGACAGSLARLAIEDPAWQGEDAVPALAAELVRCPPGGAQRGGVSGVWQAAAAVRGGDRRGSGGKPGTARSRTARVSACF